MIPEFLKIKIKDFDKRFLNELLRRFKIGHSFRGLGPSKKELEKLVSSLLKQSGSSEDFIPYSKNDFSFDNEAAKLIAFYLPQFHPIPENDLWWGKGFTEWTNVTKSVPQFVGHYQPHLPSDLGFYDLRLPEVLRQQTALAKNYGIHGFCFHYYWFSGKRLLEKPLFQFLADRTIDFPFCLCWANEPWTKRWDGRSDEVLLEQAHSTNDNLRFIEDMAPFLTDPRYIQVNGKLLLIVYNVGMFPGEDTLSMTDTWRSYCREKGMGELYLVAAQTHGFEEDPRLHGFDAAVEFPPFGINVPVVNRKMSLVNKDFKGYIFDFKRHMKEKPYLNKKDYTLFKTVFTEWDNTPRLNGRGHVFYGAGRESYREWLKDVLRFTRENHSKEERIVFINAWNEWAEGAHLEPDRKNGYAYLQITADCLKDAGRYAVE